MHRPEGSPSQGRGDGTLTREEFIDDVRDAMRLVPMATRLTPHILSLIDWSNPLGDPLRRQFIPMKSSLQEDHPKLSIDSLNEVGDSPVHGLVHRYPDKALFLGKLCSLFIHSYGETYLTKELASSICPLYCRFCTRSYSVGAETESLTKMRFLPLWKRWEKVFTHIEKSSAIQDVVVSGGDSFFLQPDQIIGIGERLLSIPHVRRLRFASKGLAVCPSRFLDPDDRWTDALIHVSDFGRKLCKQVALHTHFNHPNEITWITQEAAHRLYKSCVVVRNQTVLLRGVNNDLGTMKQLIRELADMNIQPVSTLFPCALAVRPSRIGLISDGSQYYVYQGDMVRGVEDLRTPLREILDLERQIRGTIAGFMTPQFVVDLPGGGGKRLAASFLSYDERTGISKFVAPGVKGPEQVFEYHDPIDTVSHAPKS